MCGFGILKFTKLLVRFYKDRIQTHGTIKIQKTQFLQRNVWYAALCRLYVPTEIARYVRTFILYPGE